MSFTFKHKDQIIFTEKEFFKSSKYPQLAREMHEKASKSIKAGLYILCELIMVPVRTEFGVAVTITSGYRSDKLNNALRREGYNTSPNSLHTRGIACDFTVAKRELLPFIFNYIKDELPYGELILYMVNGKPDRIHVSLPSDRGCFFRVKEEQNG
jgi:uncharacterized protein YcbK (DUF882 family)